MVVCDTCVFSGMVATAVGWCPGRESPFACVICSGLESIREREELAHEYETRREPLSVRTEMLLSPPWITRIRRAPNLRLRQSIFRMKKRRPPADVSGSGDIPGQGGDAPSERTPFLYTAAHA